MCPFQQPSFTKMVSMGQICFLTTIRLWEADHTSVPHGTPLMNWINVIGPWLPVCPVNTCLQVKKNEWTVSPDLCWQSYFSLISPKRPQQGEVGGKHGEKVGHGGWICVCGHKSLSVSVSSNDPIHVCKLWTYCMHRRLHMLEFRVSFITWNLILSAQPENLHSVNTW